MESTGFRTPSQTPSGVTNLVGIPYLRMVYCVARVLYFYLRLLVVSGKSKENIKCTSGDIRPCQQILPAPLGGSYQAAKIHCFPYSMRLSPQS